MHVDGLDGDKGTERFRILNQSLRDQPGINQGIVGVDQTARASGVLTPTSDAAELL
jgi:hypothetical protein